jgi:hypothetical protein
MNNSNLGSSSPAPTKRTAALDEGVKPGGKTKDKTKHKAGTQMVMTATMKRRALKPKKPNLEKLR